MLIKINSLNKLNFYTKRTILCPILFKHTIFVCFTSSHTKKLLEASSKAISGVPNQHTNRASPVNPSENNSVEVTPIHSGASPIQTEAAQSSINNKESFGPVGPFVSIKDKVEHLLPNKSLTTNTNSSSPPLQKDATRNYEMLREHSTKLPEDTDGDFALSPAINNVPDKLDIQQEFIAGNMDSQFVVVNSVGDLTSLKKEEHYVIGVVTPNNSITFYGIFTSSKGGAADGIKHNLRVSNQKINGDFIPQKVNNLSIQDDFGYRIPVNPVAVKRDIVDNYGNLVPSTIKGGQYVRTLTQPQVINEDQLQEVQFSVDKNATEFANSDGVKQALERTFAPLYEKDV